MAALHDLGAGFENRYDDRRQDVAFGQVWIRGRRLAGQRHRKIPRPVELGDELGQRSMSESWASRSIGGLPVNRPQLRQRLGGLLIRLARGWVDASGRDESCEGTQRGRRPVANGITVVTRPKHERGRGRDEAADQPTENLLRDRADRSRHRSRQHECQQQRELSSPHIAAEDTRKLNNKNDDQGDQRRYPWIRRNEAPDRHQHGAHQRRRYVRNQTVARTALEVGEDEETEDREHHEQRHLGVAQNQQTESQDEGLHHRGARSDTQVRQARIWRESTRHELRTDPAYRRHGIT